ncbi:MAG: SUMF1/EgtB/PvdO family nonheme iron enzyme [Armatimonadota bacterium]|nr:SUMF1/EgtB/PvdO family nonheme iron enzyme [Armatimonadota bacterium]
MLRGYFNSIGLRMALIEPGSFLMGNDDPETSRKVGGPEPLPRGDWDERPVHKVTISSPFYISAAEIIEEQYRRFDPSHEAGDFSPSVTGVSWGDAVAFCEWLSEVQGKTHRLPTEAEWEYACRAGTETLFASGDAPPEHGWANAWGLENMHAGVAEWCLDWHGMYPSDEQTDPVGPAQGFARVVRGGSAHDLRSQTSPHHGTDPYYRRSANRAGAPPGYRSRLIGFRIVEAPMPQTEPTPYRLPLACQRVDQTQAGCFGTNSESRSIAAYVRIGPPPEVPHCRKRPLLPIPPENSTPEAVEAAGMHPGILWHNHSPALEVCPNGDLLAVYFTASNPSAENWPNVALIATRLRFGSDQWDMPDMLIDLPDLVTGPSLLWNDDGVPRLFLGAIGMPGVAFLWTSSTDNGATWGEIRIVKPVGEVGGFTPQPINSSFRGPDGAMYVASDGDGNDSLLWVSRDNGETWRDTGGRTGGRHTTFVLLKDGRILGMGGKHGSIDGFMTKSISRDWGGTWEVSKSPFPALGGNQRPTIIRLASGRLFFAGDFQHFNGSQPEGVTERGAYVALSEDEGETWRVKKLEDALPHEAATIADPPGTLGYAVARQAPNGLVHLITSMNRQAMHFEMNELFVGL